MSLLSLLALTISCSRFCRIGFRTVLCHKGLPEPKLYHFHSDSTGAGGGEHEGLMGTTTIWMATNVQYTSKKNVLGLVVPQKVCACFVLVMIHVTWLSYNGQGVAENLEGP